MCDFPHWDGATGYMIVCIHDEKLQILVTYVIQCLLTRNEPVNLACVKLKVCHIAMEHSLLPQTVGELLELVGWRLYPYLLDLAFLITSISTKSGVDMVCSKAVDAVLLRLDPNYMSIFDPTKELELQVINYTPQMEAAVFSSALNVLWGLLRSLKPLQLHGSLPNIPVPSQPALWSLRHKLRLETYRKNIQARNDLLGITVLALRVFPKMLVVESGLAEDLAMLSVATELGTENTWAARVTFTNSQEDLNFKKLLLLSNCFTIRFSSAREIFKKYRVLTGILSLINPRGGTMSKVSWTPKQSWSLISLALQTLKILVPELPELFIYQKGARRLLMMIELYMQEGYNLEVLMNCVKTLTSVVGSGTKALLQDLHKQNCVYVLYRLCNYILQLPHLTVALQQVLTRIFFILEVLTSNYCISKETFGDGAVGLVMGYLNRALSPRRNDTLTDERLLICVMDFLWECIVWCPENMKHFISKGGVYKILDVIQRSKYPVKMISLAALVDLVEQGDCVPHLLTWRGQQQQSYTKLFMNIWREEEERLEVKRTDRGCLSDIEQPLMGDEQYTHTRNKDPKSSPAILDLLGSARPKIYAITQILHQRYSEVVELVNENYRINIAKLSAEDQVTLKIVENYLALKMVEVWSEVVHDLGTLGVSPLAGDGELLQTLLSHQRNWSLCIQESQSKILHTAHHKDIANEAEFYSQLEENRLHDTLDALKELDYIARTTDHEFLLAHKKNQLRQVNESIKFPEGLEEFRQHRTYPLNINVTAICNQKMTINSISEAKLEEHLELVSLESSLGDPETTDIETKSYSTDCSQGS